MSTLIQSSFIATFAAIIAVASLPPAAADDSIGPANGSGAAETIGLLPSPKPETFRGVVSNVDQRNDTIRIIRRSSDKPEDLNHRRAYKTVSLGEIDASRLQHSEGDATMRNTLWITASVLLALLAAGATAPKTDWQVLSGSFVPAAHAQDLDWQKVDEILARKPAVSSDVHRYGFPRTDLSVTLDGVTIKPALALGGWIAFKPAHGNAMIMGDLVLLESEINPVMLKMIANGIEITAVHNHLLRANPATFYMHVAGHGDPVTMATAIRDALAESKTPLTVAASTTPPPAVDLDTAQLDQIIGVKGQANGGVYQFNVPRRDAVTEDGMQLTPVGAMGLAIGINFQPTGGGKAAITGDFVLTSDEVNPVIAALRANGIEVTALHSHMLDEQPRLFFMHFWANDDAIKLAKGLRAALDKTASTKS